MKRYTYILGVGLLLLLFLWLRVLGGGIGHLLSWDEAMNLLSVRAAAAGGFDGYAPWFWRHPPFLNVLLLGLLPGDGRGFAERAEWLMLVVAGVNLVLLMWLTRRTFGTRAALWAGFWLAVMPGAVFYDSWIKQDALVTLCGLAAVSLFLTRHSLYAGVALGFAFLAKETALFYALAVFLLWCLRPSRERRVRSLGAVMLTCALISAWWYLLFSTTVREFWEQFIQGQSGVDAGTRAWAQPWYYFLQKLPLDLGLSTSLFCLLGGGFVLSRCRLSAAARGPYPALLWPLAALAPALVILTVSRLKTPWFLMSLYPLLAVLAGYGTAAVLRFIGTAGRSLDPDDVPVTLTPQRARAEATPAALPTAGGSIPRGQAVTGIQLPDGVPATHAFTKDTEERPPRGWGWMAAGLGALLLAQALAERGAAADTYTAAFAQQDEAMCWGARQSKLAAEAVRRLTAPEERVLVTPMHYWEGENGWPCPIFAYHLGPDTPVALKPCTLTVSEFVETVRFYRLHVAMVSPPPATAGPMLLGPLAKMYGLRPAVTLEGALVYRTDSLWRGQAAVRGKR